MQVKTDLSGGTHTWRQEVTSFESSLAMLDTPHPHTDTALLVHRRLDRLLRRLRREKRGAAAKDKEEISIALDNANGQFENALMHLARDEGV
jgi:hypothetical protein